MPKRIQMTYDEHMAAGKAAQEAGDLALAGEHFDEAIAISEANIARIEMAQVMTLLMPGKIKEAERFAGDARNPEPLRQYIAEWKDRYRGMPHGQWEG